MLVLCNPARLCSGSCNANRICEQARPLHLQVVTPAPVLSGVMSRHPPEAISFYVSHESSPANSQSMLLHVSCIVGLASPVPAGRSPRAANPHRDCSAVATVPAEQRRIDEAAPSGDCYRSGIQGHPKGIVLRMHRRHLILTLSCGVAVGSSGKTIKSRSRRPPMSMTV